MGDENWQTYQPQGVIFIQQQILKLIYKEMYSN